MSVRTPFVVGLLLAWSAAPVLAQNGTSIVLPGGTYLQGTPQEQAACAGDAHRFCKDDIPDSFKVLACLKTEREKITKPCRLVLESHGQ
jgi:hypothetical protein